MYLYPIESETYNYKFSTADRSNAGSKQHPVFALPTTARLQANENEAFRLKVTDIDLPDYSYNIPDGVLCVVDGKEIVVPAGSYKEDSLSKAVNQIMVSEGSPVRLVCNRTLFKYYFYNTGNDTLTLIIPANSLNTKLGFNSVNTSITAGAKHVAENFYDTRPKSLEMQLLGLEAAKSYSSSNSREPTPILTTLYSQGTGTIYSLNAVSQPEVFLKRDQDINAFSVRLVYKTGEPASINVNWNMNIEIKKFTTKKEAV